MKAIHNKELIGNAFCSTVSKIDKIQFESNSQPRIVVVRNLRQLCQRSIKYNLKAIHNTVQGGISLLATVSKIDKIQFESNSQQKQQTGT